MSNNNSSSSGIGVVGLLGVAFVVLKLTKTINWSWWYVTLPFWGGIVLALLIFTPFVIYKYRQSKKYKFGRVDNVEEYSRLTRQPKSKFQERLEEMQKKQDEQRKKNN